MSALSPDDYRAHLRGKVRAHRRAQAAPVMLATGKYAPPDARAIWRLWTPAGHALEVIARQGDREITLRIVPEGEA